MFESLSRHTAFHEKGVQMPYQPSETVVLSIEIYNLSNVLIAPDSISITIKDSAGTAVVTGGTATNDSTGKYHYDYTIAASPVKGIYEVTWTVTKDSRTTIVRDSFEVVA